MELTHNQLIEMMDANGGDLILRGLPITELPEWLMVPGNMVVGEDTPLKVLPTGLKVGGRLAIQKTEIESLGRQTYIGGDLLAWHSALKSIEPGLHVIGDADISDTPLEELPSDTYIGGVLKYHNSYNKTHLKKLSARTTVGGLIVRGYSAQSPFELPPDIEILRWLKVLCRAETCVLPDGLHVAGDLYIEGTRLPQGLVVEGNLYTKNCDQIPEDLIVRGDARFVCLKSSRVPGTITVDGTLEVGNAIEVLGEGLVVGGDLVIEGRSSRGAKELKIEKGLTVGGTLYVGERYIIRELPNDTAIGGYIKGHIERLPNNIRYVTGLEFSKCSDWAVEHLGARNQIELPEGFTTETDLRLGYHRMEGALPRGLNVGTNLDLGGSGLEIPEDTSVGERITLIETIPERIPESLSLGGEIVLGALPVRSPSTKKDLRPIKLDREGLFQLIRLLENLPDKFMVKSVQAEVSLCIVPKEEK